MTPPRTLLVVNPKSQNGALGRRWSEFSNVVRRHLGGFEEVFTKHAGDATDLTRDALRDGVEVVVAIGGDGTINEVVNGFFDEGAAVNKAAALGILPFGTGGDFRKTVRIPKDMEKAAAIIARGNRKSIDLGSMQFIDHDGNHARRIFINVASLGMGGEVDEQVNRSSKRLGGRLSFMLATAKVGLRYKPKRVRLRFDQEDEVPLEMTINTVAVANGRYFGGGMHIAPNAELADAVFDIVALGDMGIKGFLLHGRRLYQGTHLDLPDVSVRRSRALHAESIDGEDVLLDVDGEALGKLPATFAVMPGALSLLVP